MSPFFAHEKDAREYKNVQLEKQNYNYKEATLEWDSKHGYFWKPRKKRKAKKAHDQNWTAKVRASE